MCGEQGGLKEARGTRIGSPPRVRGTGLIVTYVPDILRITPACAGNSMWVISYDDLAEDHPRVCGEQKHLHSKIQRPGGSPPRVRGTELVCFIQQRGIRITPACAGNRCMWRCRKEAWGDHPRVCGEQFDQLKF